MLRHRSLLVAFVLVSACAPPPDHDLILRNGTIVDGIGTPSFVGDLAINDDRITAVGDLGDSRGVTELDVSGLVVAPGFINMLSWAGEALLEDGRSQGDIRQGVTLEVFGEGVSGGPLTDQMKTLEVTSQGDIKFDVEWTTLGDYLEHLAGKGVSPNIASFVGATTLRVHEIGYEDRPPTVDELDRMRDLVRQAMEEGAIGIGSSLIYSPGFYAKTDELIELTKVAAEYGGLYISHMRSEGNALLESVDELLRIARESGIRAEIYHLKAAGQSNWDKLGDVIERVEAARSEGLEITANMYTYTAGSTGLDAGMPPWVQEGGYNAWADRLQDPVVRDRVRQEMTTPTNEWENLLLAAGAEGTLLVGFMNASLRGYIGQTLAEVAACLVVLIHQSLLLLMEESMKVNGRMECIMVMEHILFLMVASMKVNGRMG